jgi:sec-independent protein translocase protein TatA
MGLSGISVWELLLVSVVVLLVFGSKRLPSIASDLGSAIRDFRRAVSGDETAALEPGESEGTRGSTPSRHA